MPRERDEELAAITRILQVLERLNERARIRVMSYIAARLDSDEFPVEVAEEVSRGRRTETSSPSLFPDDAEAAA